jgi:DNA-binding LacI/PurR family transcriptional regulator
MKIRTGAGRSARRVADKIRGQIAGGMFSPGSYLPPLRQLAEACGVAYVTAVRGMKLLEQEGMIRSEPRRGYVLCKGVQARGDSGALFAFVMHEKQHSDIWDETHKSLLAGFQAVSGQCGAEVLSLTSAREAPDLLLARIRRAGITGVAIDSANPASIRPLREAGVPVVLVDAFTYETPVDGVVQDNFHGGFMAGAHLAKEGHREVAWLGNRIRSIHYHERLGGVQAGLREGGARLSDRYFVDAQEACSGVPSEEAIEAARALLSMRGRPKAILALWQSMSNALLTAAHTLGLEHGRDFEMVTWGIEENRQTIYRPRFHQGDLPAMVCWSARRMAAAALARLMELHAHPESAPQRINVPTGLL